TARVRANDEIGRLLRRIDSAIDHLNVRYEFLVGELQDKLRTASGTRRDALKPAQQALESIAKRFRFGAAQGEVDTDEMNLNRIRAPLFAFILAAQGYVLDRTGQQNRAQGFALFIGAIMVATVCGPSIGGILADNIGYRLSFGVSAVMSLVSILAIARLPAMEMKLPVVVARPTRGPRMREV